MAYYNQQTGQANFSPEMQAKLNERFPGGNPFNPQGDGPERQAAEAWVEQRRQEMIEGMPTRPEFEGLRDTDGRLKEQYRIADKFKSIGSDLNTQGLEQIRKDALSQGPSQWANLATQRQQLGEQKQLGNVAATGRGRLAGGLSSLAMTGGLSSGARERAMRDLTKNTALGEQNIRGQGAQDRIGIGMADEQRQRDLLKSLPGMEAQKSNLLFNQATSERDKFLGAQSKDIQGAMGDVLQKRAFDLGNFHEQMKAHAAKMTGQAQSGGKK